MIPKLSRIERVHWACPSSADYLRKDSDGNVVVDDMGGTCRLKLHRNALAFEVEFDAVIPSKQPYYVNVVDSNKAGSSGGVIQLCYEYTRMTQLHSLAQFPARWKVPLQLAWNFYWDGRKDSPAFAPNLDPSGTTEFVCSQEVSTELPKGSKNVRDLGFSQTGVGKAAAISGGGISVWADDDISPATDLFKHTEPLVLVWDNKAVYRRINAGEMEVYVFKDRSVLQVKDGGAFYCYMADNTSDEAASGLRRFTQTSFPIRIRNQLANT